MHEVSLMENILVILRKSADENDIKQIHEITLVVGKFSMALPDSLQFAFEALRNQEQLLANAVLHITEKDIHAMCRSCSNEYVIEKTYDLSCPMCGRTDIDVLSGRELYIDSYEGE